MSKIFEGGPCSDRAALGIWFVAAVAGWTGIVGLAYLIKWSLQSLLGH